MFISKEGFSLGMYEPVSEVGKINLVKLISDGLIEEADRFLLTHQFSDYIEINVLESILEYDINWLYEMIGGEI